MPSVKPYILLFALILSGCSTPKHSVFISDNIPDFKEKGTSTSLNPALTKHIKYLQNFPQETTVEIGEKIYSYAELVLSLKHFQTLQNNYTAEELSIKIQEDFNVYQARGNNASSHNVFITGYFEPIFKGSSSPSDIFRYPIYTTPPDLITKKDSVGTKVFRQADTSSLLPYYTRKEIETQSVLQGYEAAYLKDPIDAFVLHVQGSGKLEYPDGSLHSFGYAANNGHNYKSIGRFLVDEGKMNLQETNMDSIRAYLNTHPKEQNSVLHHNPRYIFFTEKGNKAPVGSNGIELTAERSIAIDQEVLPWQTLYFLESTLPTIARQTPDNFSSFMLAQDSGAAIKGAGRVDVFWGNGEKAKDIASHMKERGRLYFLIKKGLGKPRIPTP